MKKSLFLQFLSILFLLAVLSGVCTSCASGNRLLYSVTDGDRVCELYGGNKPNRIRVTQNGNTLWEQNVRVRRNVGKQNGTYGFEVLDLNFDGLNDLKIAVSASGEQLTEICYLWDPESGSYQKCDALSGLYTIGADPDQKVLFSFTHTFEVEKAVGDTPESRISCDTATAYVWQDGVPVPYRRISLTYYSGQDIYCYSVSDRSEITGEFFDPDDKWLTPEQYAASDFGFLYYFKKS